MASAGGEQHLRFRWNDHMQHLSKVLMLQRQEERFCDVTLVSEDGFLTKAHQAVLASTSTYFQRVLGEVAADQHPMVVLRGANFRELTCLLDYMYQGNTQVEQSLIEAVLEVADLLEVKGLSRIRSNSTIQKFMSASTTSTASSSTPPPNAVPEEASDVTAPQGRTAGACEAPAHLPAPPVIAPSRDATQDGDACQTSGMDLSMAKNEPWSPREGAGGMAALTSTTTTSQKGDCEEDSGGTRKRRKIQQDSLLSEEALDSLSDPEWGRVGGSKVEERSLQQPRTITLTSITTNTAASETERWPWCLYSDVGEGEEELAPSPSLPDTSPTPDTSPAPETSLAPDTSPLPASTDAPHSSSSFLRFQAHAGPPLHPTPHTSTSQSTTHPTTSHHPTKRTNTSHHLKACTNVSHHPTHLPPHSHVQKRGPGTKHGKVGPQTDQQTRESRSEPLWAAGEAASTSRLLPITLKSTIAPTNQDTHPEESLNCGRNVTRVASSEGVVDKHEDVVEDGAVEVNSQSFYSLDERQLLKPQNRVKRPMNMYLLFHREALREVRALHPTESYLSLTHRIAARWKQMPKAEKEKWEGRARALHEEHLRQHPGYRYNPRTAAKRKWEHKGERAARQVLYRVTSSSPPQDSQQVQDSRMLEPLAWSNWHFFEGQ